ncbi:MAG: hypothetical protein ACLQT7_02635 [Candidatus Dormibacteria bacterium]
MAAPTPAPDLGPPSPSPTPYAGPWVVSPGPPPSGQVPSLADDFAYLTVTPALGGALTGWPIASAILGSGAATLFQWGACVLLLLAALGVVFRRPLARLPLGRLRWPRLRSGA